jgi:hypothetical protein
MPSERLKPFVADLKNAKIPDGAIVRIANGGKNRNLPPVTEADVKAARAELAEEAKKAAGAVEQVSDVVADVANAVADATKGTPIGGVAEVVAEVAEVVGNVADGAGEWVDDGPSDAEIAAHMERDHADHIKDAGRALLFVASVRLLDTDKGPLVERIRAVQRLLAGPVEAHPERAEADPDAPPSHVRAIATRDMRGPKGKTFHLGFGAVYKDDMADWLWRHHRKLVEPFDPKPRGPRK